MTNDYWRSDVRNRARKGEICDVCGEEKPIGTVHRSGQHLRPYEEVYLQKKKSFWHF